MSVFKKYSYWIHSGKYTAIQKLSTLVMNMVSFMLLARTLGPDGFGVWGLFLLISSITETARTALIRNAFIRFMHQEKEQEHGQLQSAALVLSLLISGVLSMLFLGLGGLAGQLLKAPDLAGMLRWYALTQMISAVFAHCEMLLNAKMDFRGICWMYCIRQGLLLGIFTLCYVGGVKMSFTMLSLFYLLSVLVGSLAGIYYARRYFSWDFVRYRGWIGQLWNFGKYVFGNNVSSLLFRSTDNFITSNYFGTAVSGYYGACLRISNLVDMPSQVLGDILFPKAAQFNREDRAAIKNMYEKTVGAILVFSLPALLVLVLVPEWPLRVIAGPKFLIAAPILRITAFFGFTLPFLKQFGTIMDATGHPAINFKVMFLALCVDIIANLAGVHFFGVRGAALGTATTYFIIFGVSQVVLYRMFGVQFWNVFKNTFSLYGELFLHVRGFVVHEKPAIK